ncbi:hypothetical protein pb186bvf_000450 [Paramecium bursaria]
MFSIIQNEQNRGQINFELFHTIRYKPFNNLNETQKDKYFKEAKAVIDEPLKNNNLLNFQEILNRSTSEIQNKKPVQQTQKDKNKFNLNNYRMFSELESSHQEQNYQEKNFKCTKCGLIFKKKKELSFHSLAHEDPQWKNNGIVCTICQSSFRRYDEFFEHNAIHFQQKKKNY